MWPSGASEVACKWLCVPLQWLHRVTLGLLMLKPSTVQSATLYFFRLSLSENLYSMCTSPEWSSILLLPRMILDIFHVLELQQWGVKHAGGERERLTDLYASWYLEPGGKGRIVTWLKLTTLNWQLWRAFLLQRIPGDALHLQEGVGSSAGAVCSVSTPVQVCAKPRSVGARFAWVSAVRISVGALEKLW